MVKWIDVQALLNTVVRKRIKSKKTICACELCGIIKKCYICFDPFDNNFEAICFDCVKAYRGGE